MSHKSTPKLTAVLLGVRSRGAMLTRAQYTAFVAVLAAAQVKASDGTPFSARVSTATQTNFPWNVTISAGAARELEDAGLIESAPRTPGGVVNVCLTDEARFAVVHTPMLLDDVKLVVDRLRDAQRESAREAQAKS